MFLAGPQDADMHQGITTLDKTRLCASLKTNFPMDISAKEAQSLAATTWGSEEQISPLGFYMSLEIRYQSGEPSSLSVHW